MTPVESQAPAARVIPLLDLTSLGDDDTAADIEALCAKAITPFGSVASICTWPRFVATAVEALTGTGIPVCAVANFPAGDDDVMLGPGSVVDQGRGASRVAAEAAAMVDAGAEEVDVVVPWRRLAAGDDAPVTQVVAAVRAEVGSEIVVKAILETGELVDEQLIVRAGHLALDGGADFLKTSTGKTARSATHDAVRTLAHVVVEREPDVGLRGVKISGGVATTDQAVAYLDIMDAAIGADRVSPATVRFGASRLLSAVLADLGPES